MAAQLRTDAAEQDRLASAFHEAGHAVAAVVLGGRIHQAVLDTGPARTEYDEPPSSAVGPIAYAGPWCEARALARLAGRYTAPGPRDMQHVLPTNCADWKILIATGGPEAAHGVVPILERCWPAVLTVAGKLFTTGTAGHRDVCAALHLTDDGGPGSVELACIRSGLRAVS
ncbi:hypothetical protein BST27_17365 [Mycobacterium intermedium]|uniref:Peptidase M41 domain-containing protein n=1 Tax=Mycobacterium intermedium TaxID=28445 RepID=A0A1E3SE42_MYCIE|nr:hypothetical protein BHQ20_13395 [Mycobacterium intermedium]OPE51101.1 hypothetical protein BV508_07760 [Mycobacterium intermedium]ORB01780.1 hypothetical protein BST27_17365 [Mycobacterium intermedium]